MRTKDSRKRTKTQYMESKWKIQDGDTPMSVRPIQRRLILCFRVVRTFQNGTESVSVRLWYCTVCYELILYGLAVFPAFGIFRDKSEEIERYSRRLSFLKCFGIRGTFGRLVKKRGSAGSTCSSQTVCGSTFNCKYLYT